MDDLQFRVQQYVSTLGSLVPPDVAAVSQQVAARVKGRLPALVGAPDLEATLRREVEREFAVHPTRFQVRPAIIAAMLMVIAAVIMLIARITAESHEDKTAAKDDAKQKQLDASKSKLQQTLAALFDEVERQRNQPFSSGRRP